jgi:uncharacterized membrane protein YphA (DoxX/SURF4 family)
MESNTQSYRKLPIHDKWINAISLVFGYLWLISGLDKILSGQFVSGFADYTNTKLANPDIFGWYKNITVSLILPHSVFFANAIQFTEVVIGLLIILGSLWNYFKHSHVAHYILGLAHLLSFLLIINIILIQGSSFPFIDPSVVFEEGVSLDFITLLTSFFLMVANFNEAYWEINEGIYESSPRKWI